MQHIRTLMWLKARLFLAPYRKRSAIVGALITLPFMLAAMLGLYFAGLVAFWGLPGEVSRQILSAGLTMVYAGWLLGPLLGVSLNEGYDISKLLHYPVSGRGIFLANILGSAIDRPVLFLSIPLLSIPVGLAAGLGGRLAIAAVLLIFLFHTVSLSQALLTLLWGLMRSRRVADFWKVVVGLAGTLFAFGNQLVTRHMDRALPSLVSARPARVTQFLPSGLCADAVLAVHTGDMAGLAWRFGVLLALCAATVALAGGLVQRVAAGELVLDRVGLPAKAPAPARRRPRKAFAPRWVHPATAAMFWVEARTTWRDPQAKLEVLQKAAGLLLFPLVMITSRSGRPDVPAWVGGLIYLGPMAYMGMLILATASSAFARDRAGLGLLFTMPAPRQSILRGKNLVAFLYLTPLNVLVAIATGVFSHAWASFVPAILAGECVLLMALGEGNILSVLTPTPAPSRGQNPYSTGRGCSPMGCLGPSLGLVVLLAAAAPVALAYAAPLLWLPKAWYLLTMPLAAAYAAAAYHFATAWAANALVSREPKVLEAVLRAGA